MMHYAEIFERRGREYHRAMCLAPEARRQEFAALFAKCPLREGELVFDIPSGGGYLANFLSVDAVVRGFEFTRGFAEGGARVALLDWEKPWEIGQADRIVSLAGLHHHPDPLAALAKLAQHVRADGWLHVADVASGSRVGAWLNGFVDEHSEMGHAGIFLPTDRGAYPHAWEITRLELVQCPWRFDSTSTMAQFCRLMFGIERASDQRILEALRDVVGVRELPHVVELEWELIYLDACGA